MGPQAVGSQGGQREPEHLPNTVTAAGSAPCLPPPASPQLTLGIVHPKEAGDGVSVPTTIAVCWLTPRRDKGSLGGVQIGPRSHSARGSQK